jgi:ATP-dependent protease Clp ATPase subunit
MPENCELCGRMVDALTEHHLYPKSQGRRAGRKIVELPTVRVCRACHRQIHALFSNKQLARELDSVEKLRAHPEMEKFLEWVRKQDPNKRIKVRG